MKKFIKISFITIIVMSFIFSGCNSSVNDTQKTPAKKTRTTYKTPVNNSTEEDDNALTQDSSLLPLTLEAIEAGTIYIYEKENRKLFIQKNDGVIQDAYSIITVEPGDKISFYGYDYIFINEYHALNIQCTGDCYVYGNVMSLLEFTTFAGKKEIKKNRAFGELFKDNTKIKNHETLDIVLPATLLTWKCYYKMFYGCTGLTKVPDLPATSLANACYSYMFSGCTGLTKAPDLPATSLAEGCYSYMFYGCTGLTTAPDLPATSLEPGCYASMFYGCSDLTTAPDLPATSLAIRCYGSMFYGCTSLTTAPDLPAATLAYDCYKTMFKGCSNLNSVTCLATKITSYTQNWLENVSETGTFVKAAGMTSWSSGASGIPEGWTVVNAN